MIRYLEGFLEAMRPAFTRKATFSWFVVIFAASVMRSDVLGVSSFVRALWLTPSCYPCLLHFFHSSAWSLHGFLTCWWKWLLNQEVAVRIGDRLVFLGDHTKSPKDGRRIPAVETLHQESETASKPGYFRGHHWGCVGLLIGAAGKWLSAPLWAEIHADCRENEPRTTRIVNMAAAVAAAMGEKAYLVLDGYFAVGPVFESARGSSLVHIVTRAKKNVVAYLPAPPPKSKRRGRRRKYGKKLKLTSLFDTWADQFQTADTDVYGHRETVRYLALDLLWKPTKGVLRFVLIESSRGRIILMTSDLTLPPLTALLLYCRRVTVETMFSCVKNILGGMCYRFWSKYLQPSSRRPVRSHSPRPLSSKPEKTRNTLAAIEKYLQVQLVVLGVLGLLALHCPHEVFANARVWLRTPCKIIPSEFITRIALGNAIRRNLAAFAKDLITRSILQRQENSARRREAA